MRNINIGKTLSEKLLNVPLKQRPLKVGGLLGNILKEARGDVVLLEHLEVLFEESLRVDPLTLLRNISRHHTIVAVWRGELRDGSLVYSIPGHPEYRSYPARDLVTVEVS